MADGTAFDHGGAAHQVQIVGIVHHAQQIIGRDGEVLAEAQQGGHQHVGAEARFQRNALWNRRCLSYATTLAGTGSAMGRPSWTKSELGKFVVAWWSG